MPDEAFWQSQLFFDLCGGKRMLLTECRRSDAELFEAYSRLPPLYNSLDIRPILESYAQRFRVSGLTQHNLTLSHEMRVRLNAKLNKLWAPKESYLLKVSGKQTAKNAQQSMLLWKGLELIGCLSTAQRGVKNGVVYRIEEVDNEKVKFEGLDHAFSYNEVRDWMRLSFARTYHSCQGVEFNEPLTLHELGHVNYNLRHLFVSLSRAKRIDMVHCAM